MANETFFLRVPPGGAQSTGTPSLFADAAAMLAVSPGGEPVLLFFRQDLTGIGGELCTLGRCALELLALP